MAAKAPGTRVAVAVLGAAIALWAIGVAAVRLDDMGDLGLVQALPVTWYAALALLVGGFVVAATGRDVPPAVLGCYVVALVVVIHGTTPLLYDEPRYAYTYKHLGLAEWFAAGGGVDRTRDVYDNWPAFFALNAWLRSVTGVAPLDYAEWAQVFFNLVLVAAVRFAVRGITADHRLLWGAAWFFVLGNWIGQDYLAPQPFALACALVVVGLCLRAAPARDGARFGTPPESARLRPWPALAAGVLCSAAVVVSHPLTPVLLILAVTVIAVAVRRLPLWVPAGLVALEAAWIAAAWPFLRERYDLLEESAGPSRLEGVPEVGVTVTAWAARGLVALMAALALAGAWRLRRAGRPWATVLLLAAAPAPAAVLGYGGEAVLRVYLFALPWLALAAAVACMPAIGERRWGGLRLGAASAAAAACLVVAYFGLELVSRVTTDDVRAATWFERHAPPGSVLVQVGPNFPDQLTARATVLERSADTFGHVLTRDPAFQGRALGRRDMRRLQRWLDGLGARRVYVVASASQARHLELYGVVPAGSLRALTQAMGRARGFRETFRSGDAVVFVRRPRRLTASASTGPSRRASWPGTGSTPSGRPSTSCPPRC